MRVRTPLVLLCLAGCAAPSPAPAPVPPPRKAEAVEAPAAVDELLRGRSAEEQARIMESERWYEIALGWFNKGDFEKAKEAARRAVQVWPEHLSARKLLADIYSILVGNGPVPTPAEHDVRVALVRTEQAQIEITKHVVDGRRYLGAKMYASALKEFEAAELKIRAMPYDVEAAKSLLPEIRAGIAASRR
jgi:tetratricopeptide (TPR) repeat protein